MNPRRLLILGVVTFVAIAAAIWLAGQRSAPAMAADTPLYADLKTQLDAIKAIRIFKAGDERVVELLRGEHGWTVTERSGYPADAAQIRKLVSALAQAKTIEEKTSNPDSYATLGVQDLSNAKTTGIRVELEGTATPIKVIIGKQAAGGKSSYARRAGEPKSWLVSQIIEAPASVDAWLSKDIFSIAADRIQSATIKADAATFYSAAKAARADANFTVDKLPRGKSLSSPQAANILATSLSSLALTDVQPAASVASTPAVTHATYRTFDGLVVDVDGWKRNDKHYIAVKTAFDAELAKRFAVATAPAADKKPATPAPTPDVSTEAQMLSTKVGNWVYEIPQYKFDAIFKPLDELTAK
jgi:hypothetical protein